MADDAQFDPFAGIITPQALQMQRLAQQQAAMQAAAQQTSGQNYGQRTAGLVAGQQIQQASQGGGQPNSPLDQLARSNQSILSSNPNITQGADQFEARAQDAEQKAQAFYSQGNYPAAGQFMNAAAYYRKQGVDQSKTLAEAFMDKAKGNDAIANMNEVKPTMTNGQPTYASVPKMGGAATPVTGVDAMPQVPTASIVMKEGQPFVNQYAVATGKAHEDATAAVQGLSTISDMRTKLDQGIISGTGSDTRQAANAVLSSIGLAAKPSSDALANTKAYAAEATQLALTLRPSGVRLTEKEWGWLNSAAGGNTDITKEGLQAILSASQKIAEGKIAKYNTMSNGLQKVAKAHGGPDGQELRDAATLYGPMDVPDSSSKAKPGQVVPPNPQAAGPAKVTGDADYAALPSGTTFVGPDGVTRKKP